MCTKVCTRLGSDDDLEANASTFSTEMRDINYLMREIDDYSLVLIDELGRGTSTTCGLALTTAICEELVKSRATILFVTHFDKLITYLQTYPNVNTIALCGQNGEGSVETGYMVNSVDSGIDFARDNGLPDQIVRDAKQMKDKLMGEDSFAFVNKAILKKAAKRRLVVKTAVRAAKIIAHTTLSNEELSRELEMLREAFQEGLERL